MKKLLLTIAFLAAFGAASSGCISSPMQGAIFTYTSHHVSMAAGNQVSSAQALKSGDSCSFGSIFSFVYLTFYGPGGSVVDAMEKGGIKKIASIDRKSMNVFGPLFHRECVVVWGE